MKKLLVIFALLAVTIATANAQQLSAKVYIEQTTVNMKNGAALGVSFPKGGGLGAFYQQTATEMLDTDEEDLMEKNYEKDFYGIYMAYPIVNKPAFELDLQVRTGMVNGENFAITPSVLAGFKPVKHITLEAGLGARSFSLTYQVGVKFNFGL